MSSVSSICSHKETQNDSIVLNNQTITESLSKLNDKFIKIKNFMNEEQDDEFENFYNRISFYFSSIVTELKLAFVENLKTNQLQEKELRNKLKELQEQLEISNQSIKNQNKVIENFQSEIRYLNKIENENKIQISSLKDQLALNDKDVIRLVNENILLKIELEEKNSEDRKSKNEISELRNINIHFKNKRSTSSSDNKNIKSIKQSKTENLQNDEMKKENSQLKQSELVKNPNQSMTTVENSHKTQNPSYDNNNINRSKNQMAKRKEENLSPNNRQEKITPPYSPISTINPTTPKIGTTPLKNSKLLKLTNELRTRNLYSNNAIVDSKTNKSEFLLKETSHISGNITSDYNNKDKLDISKEKEIVELIDNKDNFNDNKNYNKKTQVPIAPEVDKLKNIKNIFENYNDTKLISSKFFNYFSPKNIELKQNDSSANAKKVIKSSKILFTDDVQDYYDIKHIKNSQITVNKIDKSNNIVSDNRKKFEYNSIEVNRVETESDLNERLNTDGNYFINNHTSKFHNYITRKSSNSPILNRKDSSVYNSKRNASVNLNSNNNLNKTYLKKSTNLKEIKDYADFGEVDKDIKINAGETVRKNDGRDLDIHKMKIPLSNQFMINQDNHNNFMNKNNLLNLKLTPTRRENKTSLFEFKTNTKNFNKDKFSKERNKTQIENNSNVTVNSLSSFNQSITSNVSNLHDPNPSFTFNMTKENKLIEEFKSNQIANKYLVKEMKDINNVDNLKSNNRVNSYINDTNSKTGSIKDQIRNNLKSMNFGGILSNINNINNINQLKNLSNPKK